MKWNSPALPTQRNSPRISCTNHVLLRWQTPAGKSLSVRAVTRDLSDDSVYCYVEHGLAMGLVVEFDLLFPAELSGGRPQVYHCMGTVRRVERFAVRSGCGVIIVIRERTLLEPSSRHKQAS